MLLGGVMSLFLGALMLNTEYNYCRDIAIGDPFNPGTGNLMDCFWSRVGSGIVMLPLTLGAILVLIALLITHKIASK